MVKQLEIEVKDITQIPCCNTCLYGKRYYLEENDAPAGIECLKGQDNDRRFDFYCPLYKEDLEFIERNKNLLK